MTTDNKTVMSRLLFDANFFMDWVEIVCLVKSTIFVTDQADIGNALGLAAGIRTAISAISTVIYGTVLTNELIAKVPASIVTVAVFSGLAAENAGSLVLRITTGNATAIAAVPGMNPTILDAADSGRGAGKASSYRTVYLVRIAFTCLGTSASLFTEEPKHLLNQKVAATLGTLGPRRIRR